ncbi:MAG: CRISPR-associated helicase Cas3', partial [Desulfurococcales archaeon]|nr:CRISPR-associated helicase Cas3' [Desulfurococcales archaeon]
MTAKRELDPGSRPFLLKVAETLSDGWDAGGRVFLVEAPTGYGKTNLSMAIAHHVLNNGFKSIITYPLRTLIEQQSHLFKTVFGENVVGTRYMHSVESPYLVKPVTLTTIDTLAMNTLGLPPEDYNTVVNSYLGNPWGYDGHYLFARAMVDLSEIVLDEVHLVMDSTKSIGFLMALLEHMARLGRNVLLMTATLPSTLVETLTNHLSQY